MSRHRALGVILVVLAALSLLRQSAPAVPKREIVLPKKAPPAVDVMFLLDVTGSMDFAIRGVQQEMESFVDGLRSSKLDVQVGLTIFRDEFNRTPDDMASGVNDDPWVFRFPTGSSYTKNVAELKGILSKLKATGGGDGPENCLEAMRLAAQAPGRIGAVKVQILITDAEPKPWPEYKDNMAKTQNLLFEKRVQEVLLLTSQPQREVYEQLWGRTGGLQIRGQWVDIRNLGMNPGLFRKMFESVEARILTTVAGPSLGER